VALAFAWTLAVSARGAVAGKKKKCGNSKDDKANWVAKDTSDSACLWSCYSGDTKPQYQSWTQCKKQVRGPDRTKGSTVQLVDCPIPRCANCVGEWGDWTPCGEPAPASFEAEGTTFDKFEGCGVSEQSREYKVTTPAEIAEVNGVTSSNGFRGRACTTSDKSYEIRACQVPCDPASVTFTHEDGGGVASNVYDFGIKIEHNKLCGADSCQTSTKPNRDDVKCSSKIRPKSSNDDTTPYTEFLPRKKLQNNFMDRLAADERSILLTNSDGKLVGDSYVLHYSCSITQRVDKRKSMALKAYTEESFTHTETDVNLPPLKVATGEHTFEVRAGCEISVSGTTNLVRQILLNSPNYIESPCNDCDSPCVDETKEGIFRSMDTNPMDGQLSYEEIVSALRAYSADATIVGKLLTGGAQGGLGLGDFMQAHVPTARCIDTASEKNIQITNFAYPTVVAGGETTVSECDTSNSNGMAEWRYSTDRTKQPKDGDSVCVYIDGFLYESAQLLSGDDTSDDDRTEPLANGRHILRRIHDKRPMLGHGNDEDSILSLVESYTYDDEDADTDGHDYAPIVRETNGYGGLALRNPPTFHCGRSSRLPLDCQLLDSTFSFSMWAKFESGNWRNIRLAVFKNSVDDYPSVAVEYRRKRKKNTKIRLIITTSADKTPESYDLLDFVPFDQWRMLAFAVSTDGSFHFFSATLELPSTPPTVTLLKSVVPTGLSWQLIKMNENANWSTRRYIVDDARVYSGYAHQGIFEDELRCGRKPHCARLARAAPSSRRVVCVTMRRSGADEPETSCATSLYYDGTPMDIRAIMDIEGVKFIFRDTAWDENGFEIERLTVDGESSTYKTVVTISSDLNGCATTFNSITFMDGQASRTPGAEWRYRITSKFEKPRLNGLTFLRSKSVPFKTPWRASVEGYVFAGSSTTGVPDVRICADFKDDESSDTRSDKLSALAAASDGVDLALNKRVVHSNPQTRRAYVTTSGYVTEPSVEVKKEEYLRVDLGSWFTVKEIEVCAKSAPSASALEAYVHDLKMDSTNHGNRCELDPARRSSTNTNCAKFSCTGSHVSSFHGQFIDVVATSEAAQVARISVTGVRTRCKHSAFTDEDGRYEMVVEDASGRAKVKSTLHFGAYKEEIRSSSEVTLDDCAKRESYAYAILSSSLFEATQSSSGNPNDVSDDAIENVSSGDPEQTFTRFELEETVRGVVADTINDFVGIDSIIVIDDESWRRLDANDDDLVTLSQKDDFIQTLTTHMADIPGILGHVFIVFPTCEIEHKSRIEVIASHASACGEFALVRRDESKMPVTPRDRRSFYDSTLKNARTNALASECRSLSTARPVSNVGDGNLKFALPVLMVFDPSQFSSISRPIDSSIGAELNLTLKARERPPDIVHVFDKQPETKGGAKKADSDAVMMENVFSADAMHKLTEVEIVHKRIVEKDIVDDTTIIVRGAVLFPKKFTQQSSSCGLEGAVIEAMNVDGDVEEHSTDSSGWFEFALTQGRKYVLRARFQQHVICYSGAKAEDALDDVTSCSSQEIVFNDNTPKSHEEALNDFQHSTIKLDSPTEDVLVFFTDVTKAKIDVGLFQGECDGKYDDAKFELTPTNGCHASITVKNADILAWAPVELDGSQNDGDLNGFNAQTAFLWPYAAMEYSFTLIDAPDVRKVGEELNKRDMQDDCSAKAEVLDILEYFDAKDELVKYANLRDNIDGVQVRYNYHGFMCAIIDDVPKLAKDNQVCYGRSEQPGSLTSRHFIGTTEFDALKGRIDVDAKEIHVDVFEVHGATLGISECRKFPSAPQDGGKTSVSMRQDVTEEASNPCHPNRGGGPECDFDLAAHGYSGYVLFPASDGGSRDFAVVTMGVPNLAFPYRRSFSVTVTRFDNYFTTSLLVKRPLISLGSKLRSSKYDLSDDTFWATVPLDGLVYTAVHDPPGGDSYAELAVGTEIGLSFELSGTRSASSDKESFSDMKVNTETTVNPGVNTGLGVEAEMSAPVKMLTMESQFEYSMKGPQIEMTSVNQSGWDMKMTTDRVVRSSQDPAIAGHAGDTILGGGVELVYKISDVLDVYPDTGCLRSEPSITWEPRRPTTYLFAVASIERQVIPNLQFLAATAMGGNIAGDNSEMPFKCEENEDIYGPVADCTSEEIASAWYEYLVTSLDSWRRTLDWASPQVYTVVTSGEKKKNYDTIESIMKPAMSEESVFGQNYAAKSQMFQSEFIDKDMKDIMDELSNTWDASFWFMPFNGFGPPPLFAGARALGFGFQWAIPKMYWEPKVDADDPEDIANAVARVTGATGSGGIGGGILRGSTRTAGRAIANMLAQEGVSIITRRSVGPAVTQKSGLFSLATQEWSRIFAKNPPVDDVAKAADAAADTAADAAKAAKAADAAADTAADAAKAADAAADTAADAAKAAKAADAATDTAADAAKAAKAATATTAVNSKWEKFKKIATSTSAKVAAAAAVIGTMEILKHTIRKTTYPYVSFPREAYRDSIPDLLDAFKSDDDLYTFGSLTSALDDLSRTFHSCPNWDGKPQCSDTDYNGHEASVYPYYGKDGFGLGETFDLTGDELESRAAASFAGGKAPTGMNKRGESDDAGTDAILLTFSGGGHSVDYAFQSSESITDDHYSINVALHAKAANKHDIQWGGRLGFPIMLGLALAGIDDKQTWTFAKDISYDRSFFWNKHGQTSTLYTLGDPHLGDKFVVQVGSDVRFGTPVFITMGGRSLCPGEPLTIWREAGIEFATLQPSLANTDLPPGDRATLVLTIQNETPYREASPIGLQIVDLVAESVSEIVNAAYDAAWEMKSASEVSQAVRQAASKSKASEHEIVKAMVEVARMSGSGSGDQLQQLRYGMDVARRVYQESVKAPDVGYEMHDLEFLAMYKWLPPLGDVVPLKFAGGDGMRTQNTVRKTSFTLTIGRGGSALSKLEYVGLRLVSLCEFELQEGRNFDRTPIGDTVRLGTITWAHECPSVAFGKRTVEKYAYRSISVHDAKTLEIEVYGELESEDVKFSRLQYRRVGSGGEWTSARTTSSSGSLEKADMRDFTVENFVWNIDSDENLMSGYRDGEYEVRVKNFCGGSVSAGAEVYQYVSDQTLTLNVDTFAPTQQGRYEDKSSRTIWVTYLEEIDCSEMNVKLRKILDESCDDAEKEIVPLDEWKITCVHTGNKGEWVMTYPSSASGFFELEVLNIKDAAGNLADDFTWLFTAGQGVSDCSEYVCVENERVVGGACVACDEGYARPAGDNVRAGKDTTCDVCAKDYENVAGACVACVPGTTSAGGAASECAPTYCDGSSEFVSAHECKSCPIGFERSKRFTEDIPGDDASAKDTSCDQCSAGYYRKDQACTLCPQHKMSAPGSTSVDACISHRCARDEYVHEHECLACPLGYANDPGDDVAGSDTVCDKCLYGFFPTKGVCSPCETGTWIETNQTRFNNAGESIEGACPVCAENFAKKGDTCVEVETHEFSRAGSDSVENITCASGQMINGTTHACQDCPIGYANSEDRFQTGPLYMRFACTQCAENHHVSEGECVACEAGYMNDAGDDVDPQSDEGNTACRKCAADYFVMNDECVSCPVGRSSSAGSLINDGNTTCDACAVNYYEDEDQCTKCAVDEFSRGGENALCEKVKCTAETTTGGEKETMYASATTSEDVRTVYRTFVHEHSCAPCEAGYITFDESSQSCDYCDASNGFAPNGYGGCAKPTCPLGYTWHAGDKFSLPSSRTIVACDYCAENYFVTASDACERCPEGSFTDNRSRIRDGATTCSSPGARLGAKTAFKAPSVTIPARSLGRGSSDNSNTFTESSSHKALENLLSVLPIVAAFALGVALFQRSKRRNFSSVDSVDKEAVASTRLLSRLANAYGSVV